MYYCMQNAYHVGIFAKFYAIVNGARDDATFDSLRTEYCARDSEECKVIHTFNKFLLEKFSDEQ